MISRIPNPKFVYCKDCTFRKPRKTFIMGKVVRDWYCLKSGVKIRGQKGCEDGHRKSDNKKQGVLDER